jgi:hypothetical protein
VVDLAPWFRFLSVLPRASDCRSCIRCPGLQFLSSVSDFVRASFGCWVLDFVVARICSEFHFPAARVAKIRFYVPVFPSRSCERAFKGVHFFLVYSLAAASVLSSLVAHRLGSALFFGLLQHRQCLPRCRLCSSPLLPRSCLPFLFLVSQVQH